MASIISNSVAETFQFGRSLAGRLRGGEVIALCGDLGAGKTHLAKGLAEGLGCDPDEVTSPTFTLVHEYQGGRLPIFHFDFYRLESDDEALALGLDDYCAMGGIVLIEWGDKYPELLPASTRWFRLKELSPESREVLILSRFQDLRYEEIAGVLDITVGAVKVRVHRAINQLKELYTETEQNKPKHGG